MSEPPTETPSGDGDVSEASNLDVPQSVLNRITNREFTEWYSEQQFQTNILEGQAYFNGPAPPKDPDRHSPSKLLQCHRKASYARQNAPREGTPPEGLFWIGSEFEEEVIVPFLQSITTPETYVTNSLWIDTEIVVEGRTLQLRGSTDPAIVTAEADPLLLTEAEYEQAAADRERATTERANAVAAQENARAKRVFLERIGEKYLLYAGFLVFGFIPLVVGMTQVLQFTDIRLWVGSGILGLGLVIALALLALADWDRISSLLNR